MTDKSLQDKAISIKGKEYVQVKDRVNFFNDTYPKGMIQTQIVSDGERVVVRAKVTPDVSVPERYFTGISASNPSKSIEAQVPHEVAETSAVGRALGFLGIGVIDSIASVDEMHKVKTWNNYESKNKAYPDEILNEMVEEAKDVICQYHKVKMFKSPRMRNHAHKNDLGEWCNGAGFPGEKQNWTEKTKQGDIGESGYTTEEVANDVPF